MSMGKTYHIMGLLTLFESITEQYGVLFASVLVSSIFMYYYKKYTFWSRQGISGPAPIPPVGSLIYDVIYSRNRALRGWSKKYGKVYGAYNGVVPILVVSDVEIIRDIAVKDAHLFPNRMRLDNAGKLIEKMLLFRRDDDWKQLRSLMAFTMTSGKIKKMYNLIRGSSDELIENIRKGVENNEPIDIKLAYGCFTLDVIARSAFAMEFDNQESEQKYRKDLVNKMIHDFRNMPVLKLLFMVSTPKFILRAIGFEMKDILMQNHLAAISRRIIESRRNYESHKRDDLVQVLMDLNKTDPRSHDTEIDTVKGDISESHHVANYDKQELKDAKGDPRKNPAGDHMKMKNKIELDDDDIISNCILFLIAGYETTSSLLSFATYTLACHPDVQEQLYYEIKSTVDLALQDNSNVDQFGYETILSMKLLDAVISETLRMFPPAMTMHRQATSDYRIPSLDITIPAGGTVLIPLMSVHYDPTYYPEPHSFKPSRFLPVNRHKLTPYTYLPFGAGIRHCLGMRFALAEAKLALARLVYNFKFTPTDGANAKFPPKFAKTFLFLNSDHLDVKFSTRYSEFNP